MKKDMKFEDALARLEEIVEKLESGEAQLDDSIKLFEEGTKLVSFCTERLEEVKRKIEIIVNKDGKHETGLFREDGKNDERES